MHIDIIPNSGILDTIFHKTWIEISIFGVPGNNSVSLGPHAAGGGYGVPLSALIILLILATAVVGLTERLTGSKPGGMVLGIILTLLGAYLFQTFVRFNFDIVIEEVPLIASFLGAMIVAVFYTLIRKQMKGSGGGH